MEILEYLIEFNTAGTIKSYPITLAHPDTINNKEVYVTLHWLNLMFWCYQYTTPPQLQMVNCYNDDTLPKSIYYTNTT